MMYRAIWEERHKKKCACCTDEGHPWREKMEGPFLTFKEAQQALDGRCSREYEDSYHLEVRNDRVEKAQDPAWTEARAWEENDDPSAATP